MGEKKTLNDSLTESTQQICSPKFMFTPSKALYQNCIKNCEIFNFGFFFFGSFFLPFNMAVNGEL